MERNPNEAEVSAKSTGAAAAATTAVAAEADSNATLCQDLERTLTTTPQDGAAQSSSVTLKSSLKLNAKAATALRATTTASESQVAHDNHDDYDADGDDGGGGLSSKMRKLDSPVDDPEVDLKYLQLADTSMDSIPQHLSQLLQHFDANSVTQAELLMLLIYCVALESGFATQAESAKCVDVISRLSPASSYHSKNLLRLTRLKPTYISDTYKTHLVMQLHNLVQVGQPAKSAFFNALLTCLLTGDFVIVTLSPLRSRSIPGRSLCLSIGRYVLSTKSKGKPIQQRFRKLCELSSLLRENLFVPVRNQQLDALDISIYPSLLGLPAELYELIFQHLSKNQMKIVANVCKQLNQLSTKIKTTV